MWDWIWNTLIAPWPDLAVGTLEIRDVMNLVLALVGVILAGYAIKMGREQDKVTDRQLELMEGQRGLLAELRELEGRQAAIADMQLRAAAEQAKRKLEIAVELWLRVTSFEASVWFDMYIRNDGTMTCRNCAWQLNVGLMRGAEFDIEEAVVDDGVYVIKEAKGDYEGGACIRAQGYLREPLYPKQRLKLGAIVVKEVRDGLVVFWRVDSEEGPFPADAEYGRAEHHVSDEDEFPVPEPEDEDPVNNSGFTP